MSVGSPEDATQETSLEMLGQACIAIRVGDREVICDPWFSGPAQLGSWLPCPSLPAADLRERIDRAGTLFLSHDHSDHFDPKALASLSPKQIVLHRFHNAQFRAALSRAASHAGHRVTELAPGESFDVAPGFRLSIVPEQPPFRTNSMLVAETPRGTILNANDCGINSAELGAIARRTPVRVFLYTLNFMANGYPFPYLRSGDPELQPKIHAVRDRIVDSFRIGMQALKPELSMAFAGPVVYADAVNAHLNRHPEATNWSAMVEELRAYGRVDWPSPGTRVLLRRDGLDVFPQGSWKELLAQHSPVTPLAPPEPAEVDVPLLSRALSSFVDRVGSAVARSGQRVDLPLYVSVVSALDQIERGPLLRTARIDLDAPARWTFVERVAAPFLHLVSIPEIVTGFMDGTIPLDEVMASARVRFHRDPDEFNAVLHNFLRFGHDPEAVTELIRWYSGAACSRQTIIRTLGGRSYTLPKFCPHEGESFEKAVMDGSSITCPRHKWRFDLQSGACIAIGDPAVNLYGPGEVSRDH